MPDSFVHRALQNLPEQHVQLLHDGGVEVDLDAETYSLEEVEAAIAARRDSIHRPIR